MTDQRNSRGHDRLAVRADFDAVDGGVVGRRWHRAVPVGQFGLIAVYALSLFYLDKVPGWWVGALFYGAPMVFAGAWGLGVLVQRGRGAIKADGGEYMTATLGQVLVGFCAVASALLVGWSLVAPPMFD